MAPTRHRQTVPLLRLPSGTTARAGLLVVTAILGSAWIGNSLYLSIGGSSEPALWLLGAPAVLVLLTAFMVVALPLVKERRRGWRAIEPGRFPVAQERFAMLATQAGVATPTLVWNSRDTLRSPLAYGRPGRYRVAVPPGLLAGARRRPEQFDATMRHELAHVAAGDVALAYAVVASWYAFVPLVVVRLAVAAVRADFSAVPGDGWRLALLTGAVWLSRAAVLRTREHYADVRSAPGYEAAELATTFEQRAVAPSAAGTSPGRSIRRWRAVHPTPADRAVVLRRPTLLGRLSFSEFFAVGMLGAAATPVLVLLVNELSLGDPLQSEAAARFALLALVGAYTGATMVRAAGTGNSTRRSLGRAVAGMALGLTLGFAVSFAAAPTSNRPGELLAGAVTAFVCSGALVWIADLAALAIERSILTAATWAYVLIAGAMFGLVGAATSALSIVAVLGGADALWMFISSASVDDAWVDRLAVAVAVVSLAARPGLRRLPAAIAVPVSGLAAALLALRVVEGDDVASWTIAWDQAHQLVLVTAVAAAVTAAATAPRTKAVEGALAGVFVGAGGVFLHWLVSQTVPGSAGVPGASLDPSTAGWAILLGLPAAAVAALLTQAGRTAAPSRWFARSVAITGAVCLLAALPLIIAAAGPAPPDLVPQTAQQYLDRDVPAVLARRDAALATWDPAGPPDVLRAETLPGIEEAIAAARTLEPPAGAEEVQFELDLLLESNRAMVAAGIATLQNPTPLNQDYLESLIAESARNHRLFLETCQHFGIPVAPTDR